LTPPILSFDFTWRLERLSAVADFLDAHIKLLKNMMLHVEMRLMAGLSAALARGRRKGRNANVAASLRAMYQI
jgi:hypothetical protein